MNPRRTAPGKRHLAAPPVRANFHLDPKKAEIANAAIEEILAVVDGGPTSAFDSSAILRRSAAVLEQISEAVSDGPVIVSRKRDGERVLVVVIQGRPPVGGAK